MHGARTRRNAIGHLRVSGHLAEQVLAPDDNGVGVRPGRSDAYRFRARRPPRHRSRWHRRLATLMPTRPCDCKLGCRRGRHQVSAGGELGGLGDGVGDVKPWSPVKCTGAAGNASWWKPVSRPRRPTRKALAGGTSGAHCPDRSCLRNPHENRHQPVCAERGRDASKPAARPTAGRLASDGRRPRPAHRPAPAEGLERATLGGYRRVAGNQSRLHSAPGVSPRSQEPPAPHHDPLAAQPSERTTWASPSCSNE